MGLCTPGQLHTIPAGGVIVSTAGTADFSRFRMVWVSGGAFCAKEKASFRMPFLIEIKKLCRLFCLPVEAAVAEIDHQLAGDHGDI